MMFSSDWISRHKESWKLLLSHLAGAPDLHFLEIGTFEGRAAVWFLRNILTHPTSRLAVIEPWGEEAQGAEPIFDSNIKETGQGRQIDKCKGTSRQVLPTIVKGDYFDFCYIDGDHEASAVLLDGLMVLPLMKPGGIILFDDYEMDAQFCWREGDKPPKAGIDAFISVVGGKIEVIHSGYQVAVRKL